MPGTGQDFWWSWGRIGEWGRAGRGESIAQPLCTGRGIVGVHRSTPPPPPHPQKAEAPAKHHPGTARKKSDGGHGFAPALAPLAVAGRRHKAPAGEDPAGIKKTGEDGGRRCQPPHRAHSSPACGMGCWPNPGRFIPGQGYKSHFPPGWAVTPVMAELGRIRPSGATGGAPGTGWMGVAA